MLKDIVLAAITPFDEDNNIDFSGAEKLLSFWRDEGVKNFFICGTCGEMMSLSNEERKRIIDFYTKRKEEDEHICVHVGGCEKESIIDLSRYSYDKNADSIAIVTPNYYKISQEELIEFYRHILNNIPNNEVYLYNIPQCTGLDILPETFVRLCNEFPHIAGIKYSFFDFSRIHEYLYKTPKNIIVLSGTDHMLIGLIASGVKGIITGIGCVYPKVFLSLLKAFKEHDEELVIKLQELAIEISSILDYGYVPFFKELLSYKGFCSSYCRKPYNPISEEKRKKLLNGSKVWEEKFNKILS